MFIKQVNTRPFCNSSVVNGTHKTLGIQDYWCLILITCTFATKYMTPVMGVGGRKYFSKKLARNL